MNRKQRVKNNRIMKTIYYKGKGNHSVNDLEKIVEQQKEELNQIKSSQTNWKLVDSDFISDVRLSLPLEEIKKAVYKFKKEELPDAEVPYHYEAEIWAGMKSFIKWIESKSNEA